MRITAEGQVTIPADILEQAGLAPDTDVECTFDGADIRIRRADGAKDEGRGARLIARLRGTGDVQMTTDEIMALTRGD